MKEAISETVLQRTCDIPEASAVYLVFPVNENTRTYANGDIRFAHLNTFGEPAAGASHVMVSFRKQTDPVFSCVMLSLTEAVGFSDVDLMLAQSQYDPSTGLLVKIPVRIYDGNGFVDRTLAVQINRASGTVIAALVA